MTRRSLRLRLLLAAAISISLALVVAGFGLVALFDRHVERRVDVELGTFLNQIAAALDFDEAGLPYLTVPPADPRFAQPYGGLYWQISPVDVKLGDVNPGGATPVRSRSLWDVVLALPPATDAAEATATEATGALRIYSLAGPDSSHLRVYERRLTFVRDSGERQLRIAVAINQKELRHARHEFVEDIVPALALLALVLTAAFWAQVVIGLRPLNAVLQAVKAVRTGTARRLSADVPDEIQPLVGEVNELLSMQEQTVERARARAGDLAHGLKTPLTVLANDAHKLRGRGESEIAGEIEQLVTRMRRHVDHELARVRIAAHTRRPPGEADLVHAIAGVVATLKRAPKGETLVWDVPALATDIAMGRVAIDPHDLTELLGNLVDNAVTWAKSEVRIELLRDGAMAVISIADDGPGVPPTALEALGKRGVRLDEQVTGTGIGLAIVRELLAAYGGSLSLSNRAEGGLLAEIRLPLLAIS